MLVLSLDFSRSRSVGGGGGGVGGGLSTAAVEDLVGSSVEDSGSASTLALLLQ